MLDMPNLNLMRSFAIILIVIEHTLLSKGFESWHSWPIDQIGQVGIYLFCIHTCLVLMWSLERRPKPLNFYIRRLFRVYPLAVLTILIAAATHAPVAGYVGHYFHAIQFTPRSLLVNALLLGRGPFIHGITWGLGSELYICLLLPCLFFYARSVKTIWPLLLIWLLVVRLGRLFFPGTEGSSFPMLLPDFLAGGIAYVGFMRKRPLLPAWVLLPVLAVMFVGCMSFYWLRFDWYACLVLALLLPSIRQFEAKIPVRIAHVLAISSYAIFLIHPFTIVLGMHVLAGRPLAVQLAIELGSLIVAVYLAYHFVERPMIRLGSRLAARIEKSYEHHADENYRVVSTS